MNLGRLDRSLAPLAALAALACAGGPKPAPAPAPRAAPASSNAPARPAGGSASKSASGPATAAGRPGDARAFGLSYSVPIPANFAQIKPGANATTDQLLQAGGLALYETRSPHPGGGWLMANLVILPITELTDDSTDLRVCTSLAAQSAKSVNASVKNAAVMETSSGRTCRWMVVDNQTPTRGATNYVVHLASHLWGLTCNYDVRDQPAQEACGALVAGWRLEEPVAPAAPGP